MKIIHPPFCSLVLLAPAVLLAACAHDDDAGPDGAAQEAALLADALPSPGATGACLGPADEEVLTAPDSEVREAVVSCGMTHLGAEPATFDCIRATGLSAGCAQCFDDTIRCVIDRCLLPCISAPEGRPCLVCRAARCDPAFTTCSGIPVEAPPP